MPLPACPPIDELRRLLDGDSPNGAYGEHLRDCSSCQETLDRLSDDSEMRGWVATLHQVPATPGLSRVVNALLHCPFETFGKPAYLDPPTRTEDIGALGGFQIESELGRGGMGVVYRAHDPRLNRTVAIKVLRPNADDAVSRARLTREARALARLKHPNVVEVYASDQTASSVPFLVMEFVAGPSLAARLLDGPMESRLTAALIAAAADGLQAAHTAGLIHRDVKPGNILLADGHVAKVTDFGLVRAADVTQTGPGILAGTPAFMSPEQVRTPDAIDARADVYGLGATLYECLTGQLPFTGSAAMTIRQVLEDEPRPPRSLNEAVPRDLEVICLKALAKDPARRYQSAGEFSDDVHRWLNGEPIQARATGRAERAWRWVRRNPKLAGAMSASAALLLALAVGGTTAAILIGRAYSRADAERQAAVDATRRAEADFANAVGALDTLIDSVQNKMGNRPGLLALKRQILEEAAKRLDEVVRSQADVLRTDRLSVIAHERLGSVYHDLGRTKDAAREFNSGLARVEAWANREPENVDAQRALANVHDWLGNLAWAAQNSADATTHYQQAFEVRKRLSARDPSDRRATRDLSVSHHKLGDAYALTPQLDVARAHFEASLKLAESIPATGESAQRLLDLRFRHCRICDVCTFMNDLTAAEHHAQAALDCARELAKTDADTARVEIAQSLTRLGRVAQARFDLPAAVSYRAECVARHRDIVAADPNNQEAVRGLYTALSQFGDVLRAAGRIEDARTVQLESAGLCEAALAADPGSVIKAINLRIAWSRLSAIDEDLGRFADAKNWWDKTAELCRQAEANPKAVHLKPKEFREWAEAGAGVFAAAVRLGLDNVAAIDAQVPDLCWRMWRLRALELSRTGRRDEAASAAIKLLDLTGTSSEGQLAAARVFARVGDVDRAIAALREAIRLEPALLADLSSYPEFVALRERPDFQALRNKP